MRFGEVDLFVDNLLRKVPMEGAALIISVGNEIVYARGFGSISLENRLPVASVSKWVSAAVIATLIDDGTLHLDEFVGDYIEAFEGSKSRITLRQLLAHTSGLPKGEEPCIDDPTATLESCANAIARVPMAGEPGVQFAYGENSYQVAGRMAEIAANRLWHDLFVERIAFPLGLTHTDYAQRSVEPGIVRVIHPRISSGLRSTAHDLARFTRMMANGGVLDGQRVLSEAMVARMFEDHTFGAPIAFSPNLVPGAGYGLGVWRERADAQGRALQVSSPGAFGTTPWVDVASKIGAVFVARNAYARLAKPVAELQTLVREAAAAD